MWAKLITAVGHGGWRFFKVAAPAAFKGFVPSVAAFFFWYSDGAWQFIGVMWELMPDDLQADFAPHLTWFHMANAWFPLDLWFSWTLQFYSFYITFVAVRFVYRSIPTLA